MRRATLALILGLTFASYALPQEAAHSTEARQENEQGDPWLLWKWANFAILAIGLGYLIGKNVPPLFRQRTQDIQQAMADAAKMKQDAEVHAAEIDKRLAGMSAEIETLRSEASTQTAADGRRISSETEERLAKIQSQAAAEIALMTRSGREELRKYAARLALDLAEQRIRSRVTPDTQNNLVDGFLHDLRARN